MPDSDTPVDVITYGSHTNISPYEGRWKDDPTTFDYCGYFATPNLKSIQFGSFFPYVPRHCCDGAKKLKKVTFTDAFLKNKPVIGGSAFANTGLEAVELPAGIIQVGGSCFGNYDTHPDKYRDHDTIFRGSKSLTTISCGSTIKDFTIGDKDDNPSLTDVYMYCKNPETKMSSYSKESFGGNLTIHCYSGTNMAYIAYNYYTFDSLGQCDGEPWTPEPTTTTTEPTTAPPSEPYTTPISENDEWFVGGDGLRSSEKPLKMTYDSETKEFYANVRLGWPDEYTVYVFSGDNGAKTALYDEEDTSIKLFGFNGSSKYNHILYWFPIEQNRDFMDGNYTVDSSSIKKQPFEGKLTFDGTKVRAFYIDNECNEIELYSCLPPQATATTTTTTAPPTTTTTLPTTVVPSTTLPETTDVTLKYKGTTYTNSKPKMVVGRSIDYDYSFFYPQSTCSVELESSNKKVAQVNLLSYDKQSQTGKMQIVALSEGTANITIKIKSLSGRLVGAKTINLTVTPKVKSINIKEGKKDCTEKGIYVGNTTTLKAVVSPANAIQKVTWKSTNTKVATVDSNGKVTAVGKGTCDIQAWATDGSGKYKSCKVNVFVRKIKSIKLSKSTLVFKDNKGASKTLTATVSPANASYAKNIKWSSNKPNVATVTSKGTVTPKKNGACWIYAKATDGSGITAKCLVIVGPQVKSIKLNTTSVTLKPKKTKTLKVTYDAKAVYKKVQWTTSDNKIATVNSNGKVTAKKKGTCYITAKALDGSNKTVKCKVAVK